jgi:hypothetical protein
VGEAAVEQQWRRDRVGGAECGTERGRRLAELRLRAGAEEGRKPSKHTAGEEGSPTACVYVNMGCVYVMYSCSAVSLSFEILVHMLSLEFIYPINV